MHLHAFRFPGGTPTPHLLQVWVLLLVAPACFALVMMPMTIAVVAVTVMFALPLAIRLALHVHHSSEIPAQLPGAIRFAVGVSVTGLGLVGLFAFSTALACATVAAYVVTFGLRSTWGRTHSGARAAASTATADATPFPADHEAEPTSVVVTHDLVQEMTDSELCHAWRRSFVALQQARGLHLRAMVVHTRQLLLDEAAARHPEGLRAWLSSGARAASGLDLIIGPAGGSGHPEAA